jgi:arabinose-5-phosphate isomerase
MNINIGKEVFDLQSVAVRDAGARLNDSFFKAIDLLHDAKGKVIVSGMGKSGIVGKKIAATLASTGSSSFFVHPAEAYHGDLGMYSVGDVAVLISYSGETEEVIRLIPFLKSFNIRTIALVGRLNSTLAKNCDVALDVSVEKEACPNDLAPTTSTTVCMVMGDALAVALMQKRNFQPKDFAIFHPGGSLGKKLLTKVKDIMHSELPLCSPLDDIRDVILVMTRNKLGLAVVADSTGVQGLITDGDLRRALFNSSGLNNLVAADVMTRDPVFISEEEMFSVAEEKMLARDITSLLVMNDKNEISGILKLQDAKLIS